MLAGKQHRSYGCVLALNKIIAMVVMSVVASTSLFRDL